MLNVDLLEKGFVPNITCILCSLDHSKPCDIQCEGQPPCWKTKLKPLLFSKENTKKENNSFGIL